MDGIKSKEKSEGIKSEGGKVSDTKNKATVVPIFTFVGFHMGHPVLGTCVYL